MRQVVPVVFATDEKYAPYCSVAIASVIQNRDLAREYEIYVFYDKLSRIAVEKLEGMSQARINVQCINVLKYADVDSMYTTERYPLSVYHRLFIADVLPQYDKALYLDCDTVALKDVGELFDIDIGENLVAGVLDRPFVDGVNGKHKYLHEVLKDKVKPEEYINTGVLLVNLKKFKEEKVKEQCVQYLKENTGLRLMDQDTINVVCNGRILILPYKWNKFSDYYYEEPYSGFNPEKIGIVHYTMHKPWIVGGHVAHCHYTKMLPFSPYQEELQNSLKVKYAKSQAEVALEYVEHGMYGMRTIIQMPRVWLKRKIKRWFSQ